MGFEKRPQAMQPGTWVAELKPPQTVAERQPVRLHAFDRASHLGMLQAEKSRGVSAPSHRVDPGIQDSLLPCEVREERRRRRVEQAAQAAGQAGVVERGRQGADRLDPLQDVLDLAVLASHGSHPGRRFRRSAPHVTKALPPGPPWRGHSGRHLFNGRGGEEELPLLLDVGPEYGGKIPQPRAQVVELSVGRLGPPHRVQVDLQSPEADPEPVVLQGEQPDGRLRAWPGPPTRVSRAHGIDVTAEYGFGGPKHPAHASREAGRADRPRMPRRHRERLGDRKKITRVRSGRTPLGAHRVAPEFRSRELPRPRIGNRRQPRRWGSQLSPGFPSAHRPVPYHGDGSSDGSVAYTVSKPIAQTWRASRAAISRSAVGAR